MSAADGTEANDETNLFDFGVDWLCYSWKCARQLNFNRSPRDIDTDERSTLKCNQLMASSIHGHRVSVSINSQFARERSWLQTFATFATQIDEINLISTFKLSNWTKASEEVTKLRILRDSRRCRQSSSLHEFLMVLIDNADFRLKGNLVESSLNEMQKVVKCEFKTKFIAETQFSWLLRIKIESRSKSNLNFRLVVKN